MSTELRTPLAGGGEALSRSVVLDDGARFALLHVPGLFRYDVCPRQDTLRSVLRNLTDPVAPLVQEHIDARPPVVGTEEAVEALGPRPLTLEVRFVAGDRSVEIVLLATQDPATGRTAITAQATIVPA